VAVPNEIKDIRDELNIIRRVFDDRKSIFHRLISICKTVGESQEANGPQNNTDRDDDPKEKTAQTEERMNYCQEWSGLDARIREIKSMGKEIHRTYESVRNSQIQSH
jgi:hypothetical protein